MKLGVGIRGNSIQLLVSSARVAFDPRTVEDVEKSRDPKNYKAAEEPLRAQRWANRSSHRKQAAE